MGKHRFLFLLLLAAIVGLAGCGTQGEDAVLEVGDQAPEFRLPSASGSDVALADYLNEQPVLLYFHMAMG